MNKLDGVHKAVYDVGVDGRILPRSAKGRKITGHYSIKGEDALVGSTSARSFLRGEHDSESLSVWCSREDEQKAIEDFVNRVGVTTCPDAVSKGALPKHSKPKVVGLKEVVMVKTKKFRMAGDLQSPKVEKRIMASEHVLCPVCDRLFPGPAKGKCPDCGHDMRRKQATLKEVKTWLKKFGELPINLRVYRGFNHHDLKRFALEASQHKVSYGDVVQAFNRLFDMRTKMNGGEDWMRLMVGYELQRRLIYPKGETELVKRRRQQIVKGIIPADLKALIESKNRQEKETEMAKKEMAKKGTKKTSDNGDKTDRRRIDCFGLPVTAVVRWFGKNGYSAAQCLHVMSKLGVPVKRGTVQLSISIGRTGEYLGRTFEPTKLADADVKVIKRHLAELGQEGLPGNGKTRKIVKKVEKKVAKSKVEPSAKEKKTPPAKKLPPKKKTK